MKKSLKTLLITPIIVGGAALTSCSNQKTKTLFQIERQYQIKNTVEINYTELQGKFSNKNSFVLYISDPSCSACALVDPMINTYIKNTQAIIYSISATNLQTNNDLVPYSVTPTIAIVLEGQVKEKVDYTSNESLFASSNTLTNYLNSKVTLSPQIEITEDDYDKLIKSDENFIILFRWNKCGDCVSMDDYFFNEYKEKNPNNTFYSFELSYYYSNRENSSDPLWTNFTEKVQLSKVGNEQFGYNRGVVPTFQYIEKGQVKDAVVVYNDGAEYTKNDNGEIVSIKITSSYFSDAPFINKTYEATNDLNCMQNYKKSTASFFDGKVKELFKHLYK